MEARTNGYDDAIIPTRDGKVSESTGASLMLVRDWTLVSPTITSGILESITRKVLLQLFEKHYGTPRRRNGRWTGRSCISPMRLYLRLGGRSHARGLCRPHPGRRRLGRPDDPATADVILRCSAR